ncbi:MAG TPA: septation protein A [Rhizomicrobium sp.]|jgi:intracellular septation protein|nr:septation protein A [Rhizomicrobium sp.]
MSDAAKTPKRLPPLGRAALDLGPLILFFAAYRFFDIFVATGTFMVAVLAALAIGYMIERRVSPVPVFTAVLVLIFGGLTLYLKNDTFIKMKPTVLYAFFGLLLLGGLCFNRLFIKYVFEQAFQLTETGWRQLTIRWGIFALVLAVINEAIWRNFSTDVWVDFKVWAIIPLIFLFALAQTPFVMKHTIEEKEAAD